MADLRTLQAAFTAGELGPALWARVDLSKYGSGLKTALNVFVHPHGGASNRPGLEFVAEVKDSTKLTRLIPFQFNTKQSYILEYGNLHLRVFRNGGRVAGYELATPYTAAQVGDLGHIQEADVMCLTHTGQPPRKLGRLADNSWTLNTVTFAPKIAAPASAAAAVAAGSGSTSYRYQVAAIDDVSGEESLPSRRTRSTTI
jgi:hypothetical protein